METHRDPQVGKDGPCVSRSGAHPPRGPTPNRERIQPWAEQPGDESRVEILGMVEIRGAQAGGMNGIPQEQGAASTRLGRRLPSGRDQGPPALVFPQLRRMASVALCLEDHLFPL